MSENIFSDSTLGAVIDGKKSAAKIKAQIKEKVATHRTNGSRAPGLCTLLVGEDPASEVYVRYKRKDAAFVGFESFHEQLPEDMSEAALLEKIETLNERDDVDGILVQLPLPKHINADQVIEAIAPEKDVDGFHPRNVANLALQKPGFWPCTPKGCMHLLDELGIALRGKKAVVVGVSRIVGQPMMQLLVHRRATVTICHSGTVDLAAHTRDADIVVMAVGRPNLLTADMVKKGAVVIDVGINRGDDGKLVGDVAYDEVKEVAGALTPVPGGVGPMTRAMLLVNTLDAYEANL
ncbi:MAG: bifunctional methylenetetrahydrofolate dehydrogenase/methenyltetrahydrofolate cyclohydrolase FolD [Deltaproteobacteria bacterium]|nr:bifunctional methylenetetrahydrofolate dehydrogenase/methenyltetrahydrofolate cyclohydrolase FolD [Deltaproteobacteria bacterium]